MPGHILLRGGAGLTVHRPSVTRDRASIAQAREQRSNELQAAENELGLRLRQAARLSSLAVRVDHRIDALRDEITSKRAALARIENAARVVRPQHRR